METHDLIIIGAGPAGFSASVYASRYGIEHLVIGEISGGLTTQTFEIGNWLGTQNILGNDYALASAEHVRSYGVEIRPETVTGIVRRDDGMMVLTLASGGSIMAKSVLLATGTHHRELGIPGEKEFAGKGVSYCPTCDGFFFRGKTVAVVGGGDSAASAGVYLAGLCLRVFIIVREASMRAEKFWQEALAKYEHVSVIYDTNVKEIRGENRVGSLLLDKPYENRETIDTDGIFIEIGLIPSTRALGDLQVEKDTYGYIKTAPDQSTSIPGLWAAGDITTNSNYFHQIVTAASEGAIASESILKFLQKS